MSKFKLLPGLVLVVLLIACNDQAVKVPTLDVYTFGTQTLEKWVRNGGDFNRTFHNSKDEFWTKWVDYLKVVY